MSWDDLHDRFFRKDKKKEFAKGVAASAAVAGLIATARKMHEKGYDEKAVEILKESADTLKSEARKLEKRIKKEVAKSRSPSDAEIRKLKKQAQSMTKKELQRFAREQYHINLSTTDLKKEMVDNFVRELRKR